MGTWYAISDHGNVDGQDTWTLHLFADTGAVLERDEASCTEQEAKRRAAIRNTDRSQRII